MVHSPLHIKQQDWEQAFGAEISGIIVDYQPLVNQNDPTNYCAETLCVVPILFVVYKVANGRYCRRGCVAGQVLLCFKGTQTKLMD